jgi:hypothetical protein
VSESTAVTRVEATRLVGSRGDRTAIVSRTVSDSTKLPLAGGETSGTVTLRETSGLEPALRVVSDGQAANGKPLARLEDGRVDVWRDTSGRTILDSRVGATLEEAVVRFRMQASGRLDWRDDDGVTDVSLFRQSSTGGGTPGVLRIGPSGTGWGRLDVYAGTADATRSVLRLVVSGETEPRVRFRSTGRVEFGSGSETPDVNLYRSAADTLRTDDALEVGAGLAVTGGATVSGLLSVGGGITENAPPSSGSAAYAADVSAATVHVLTLDAATCAVTVTNPPVTGKSTTVTFVLKQDATGSRLVSWPAAFLWPGGTPPTLSTAANAVDVVTALTVDGGTTWLATTAKAFA